MEWMRSGDMFEVLMQWRRRSCESAGGVGSSLKAIGRAFGKPSSSIYFQVAPHWGSSCAEAAFPLAIDAFGAR